MDDATLICHIRPARRKARRPAEIEMLSVLAGLGSQVQTGGPLSEKGGVFGCHCLQLRWRRREPGFSGLDTLPQSIPWSLIEVNTAPVRDTTSLAGAISCSSRSDFMRKMRMRRDIVRLTDALSTSRTAAGRFVRFAVIEAGAPRSTGAVCRLTTLES